MSNSHMTRLIVREGLIARLNTKKKTGLSKQKETE